MTCLVSLSRAIPTLVGWRWDPCGPLASTTARCIPTGSLSTSKGQHSLSTPGIIRWGERQSGRVQSRQETPCSFKDTSACRGNSQRFLRLISTPHQAATLCRRRSWVSGPSMRGLPSRRLGQEPSRTVLSTSWRRWMSTGNMRGISSHSR